MKCYTFRVSTWNNGWITRTHKDCSLVVHLTFYRFSSEPSSVCYKTFAARFVLSDAQARFMDLAPLKGINPPSLWFPASQRMKTLGSDWQRHFRGQTAKTKLKKLYQRRLPVNFATVAKKIGEPACQFFGKITGDHPGYYATESVFCSSFCVSS